MAKKRPDLFRPLDEMKTSANAPGAQSARPKPADPAWRYTYLDPLVEPDYLFLDPAHLDNKGLLIGNAYYQASEDEFVADVVTIRNGKIIARARNGYASTANEKGLAVGLVITDPVFFYSQAAFFEGNQKRLIPRRPGERSSQALQVNDDGAALVYSEDQSGNGSLWIYRQGIWTAFDPSETGYLVQSSILTGRGLIAGSLVYSVDANNFITYRGYQFDPRTGKLALFNPAFPGDTDTQIMAVNSEEELLGYSYIPGRTEHIGIWTSPGRFKHYFTEGTAQYPTISNRLAFSDNDQIVIYRISRPADEVNNAYYVPKPGVRINIQDYVTGMPPEHGRLYFFKSINNDGDMLGVTATPDFFSYPFLLTNLKRSGH
ncbi:hypothetical protein K788_0007872 (plasmid) [Paraburkholderia caribensis MBA4]|uniref:Uncharacterized protein n=2 Tax=Paraburkholderia caribensis TaxID=75105 RepID=A0A0N7JVM4_9BURK|nr:hypothetical protein K788_0007872 [Paraburkholderia caribensis MBA4]